MAKATLSTKDLIYSIDDDPSMNQLMAARFTKFGCSIKTFTDPKLLLEAIEKTPPHLLILDLNLGEGVTGFDIIEKIRIEFSKEFPIIVVSSESQSSQVAHALEIGATDFIVKPPFRFAFEEKVAEHLKNSHLSETSDPALEFVPQEHQSAKIDFKMKIKEVNPFGFTLVSSHLIKKGSSFWLSGEALKKIIPSNESVFVTVLGSAMLLSHEKKEYQIRVEIDPTRDEVAQDLKSFLAKSRSSAQA